jgi:orotidine-5'-phosphate decarboxylase
LAEKLQSAVGLVKVGSLLFTAEGPRAVEKLAGLGFGIFLDLKFHDIPNTVAGAVRAAVSLPEVRMMTLHATGGVAMMEAAKNAVAGRSRPPALLGVTILTSLDEQSLEGIGIEGPASVRVLALAQLAKRAGLDGVVASAHEARNIRDKCGDKFLIVVPGVRPTQTSVDDQSRVATPAEAIRAGADYLVVGRPITSAKNPREAALAIAKEIGSAADTSSAQA